jgi:hypothetical protein
MRSPRLAKRVRDSARVAWHGASAGYKMLHIVSGCANAYILDAGVWHRWLNSLRLQNKVGGDVGCRYLTAPASGRRRLPQPQTCWGYEYCDRYLIHRKIVSRLESLDSSLLAVNHRNEHNTPVVSPPQHVITTLQSTHPVQNCLKRHT